MAGALKIELEERTLNEFWQSALSGKMLSFFPEYADAPQYDAWKVSGWNDGTVTLHCVKRVEGKFYMFSFPDYGDNSMKEVSPKIVHAGWG